MRTLIVRIFDAEDATRDDGLHGVVERVGGAEPHRRNFDGEHDLLASIHALATGEGSVTQKGSHGPVNE